MSKEGQLLPQHVAPESSLVKSNVWGFVKNNRHKFVIFRLHLPCAGIAGVNHWGLIRMRTILIAAVSPVILLWSWLFRLIVFKGCCQGHAAEDDHASLILRLGSVLHHCAWFTLRWGSVPASCLLSNGSTDWATDTTWVWFWRRYCGTHPCVKFLHLGVAYTHQRAFNSRALHPRGIYSAARCFSDDCHWSCYEYQTWRCYKRSQRYLIIFGCVIFILLGKDVKVEWLGHVASMCLTA